METKPNELEEWDDRYQKGDTPWEKGFAAPPLTEFLARRKLQGRIFVPGCGTGHDVRALAAQGAEVTGLDIAPRAIRLAKSFPVMNRESYLLGNLFELSENLKNQFDWVFEHTCFCAIPPARRPAYVHAVHGALKKSGAILAIFFINPDQDQEGPPYRVSKEEINKLFGPCFELQEEWNPSLAYPGREGRERMMLLKKRGSD